MTLRYTCDRCGSIIRHEYYEQEGNCYHVAINVDAATPDFEPFRSMGDIEYTTCDKYEDICQGCADTLVNSIRQAIDGWETE